jgi:hypothetical protein
MVTGSKWQFGVAVVTDGQGRYVVPDLPKASYTLWVRGYGLFDSAKITAQPGRIDDPNAGWKGRGLWSSSGDRTPWLAETGKGSRPMAPLPAATGSAGEGSAAARLSPIVAPQRAPPCHPWQGWARRLSYQRP